MLTVYGIETPGQLLRDDDGNVIGVATVLTVYGIETVAILALTVSPCSRVATVLTVYGIETVRVQYS